MMESVTYCHILDEGALKVLRKLLLRWGQKKLGPASEDVITAVNGIEEVEQLERMHEQLADVGSWQELLQIP